MSTGRMSAKPSILFVLSDQQRWDTLGCYGQALEITPNLDRMAAEGVRFENAFTCQPLCGPVRACLQTGKYATETGCFRNGIALPPDEKTIAHRLGATGYDVAYIGKWHLASTSGMGEADADFRMKPVPPERRGGYTGFWLAADVPEFTSHSYDGHLFDAGMRRVEFPKGRYRVDCLTDFAEDYLRSRTREKPFFLFLSYVEPHHQNDRNRYEGPTGSTARFRDFPVPGDLAGMQGDWRESYPDYLGCVNSLDGAVGRLRGVLEELGLAEETLIVYTSDHGSHFRTHNEEYKRSCHDGCVRVPMIACGPGFRVGTVVEQLVSSIDLPPTLLAAAGVATPAEMRGRALQPLVEGTAVSWPQEVFIQISESLVGRAVRTRRWKYSVRAPGDVDPLNTCGSDVYVEDFLYDLESDPHERRNLVTDPAYANVRSELSRTLRRLMREAGEPEPVIQVSPTSA